MKAKKNFVIKFVKKNTLPFFLIVAVAVYPILFLLFRNASEIGFSEIGKISCIFIIISLITWIILTFFLKDTNKSAIITFLIIMFCENYMIMQKVIVFVFKDLKYWHILPILLLILLAIIILICKKVRADFSKDIILVLSIVLVSLLIINCVPAIPKMIAKAQLDSINADQGNGGTSVEGPNIYWMIFDECASFETIEKYYDYSDKTVYNFLQNSGFEISDSSHNECGNTFTVLTNYVNLEYVANSSMDATQMQQMRENPLLYTLLEENGYTLRGVGDTAWLCVESANYNNGEKAATVEGFDVNDLVLQNTIIAPFVLYDGTATAKLIEDSFEYMKDESNFQPNTAQCTIFYVSSPHQPFLFDENGNSVASANYNNWSDEKYYLGQYRFVMKNIMEMVESILKNDSDSIIFVCSDHGPRFNNEMPYEDKISILNAVYYRGEEISEINGKSGVNTLRIIMNRLFGYELEELEVKENE